MAKYLKSIYQLKSIFCVLPAKYTRTVEFGLLPTQEQVTKLDTWFEQVMVVKKGLYIHLYQQFMLSPSDFLGQVNVSYKTIFKGRDLLSSLKQGKNLITDVPIGEGLRSEIIGTINSYLTNHKKAFKTIQDDIAKLTDSVKDNLQIVESLPRDNPLHGEVKNITSELEAKAEELIKFVYGDIIKTTQNIQCFVQKLNLFNRLVSSYNYNLNLLKQVYSQDALKFLRTTQRLPEFPNSKEFGNHNDINKLIAELDQSAKITYEAEKILSKLKTDVEKEKEKEKWLLAHFEKTKKKRNFISKLRHWLINNQDGYAENIIKIYFQKLDSKIERLHKQFEANYDLPAFRQIVYLKAHKARLINPQAIERINEITSTLAMELLKGKSEIEEFILPGFSWDKKSGKPDKHVALGFRNKLFYLLFSNSATDFTIKEGKTEFIKTEGGGRTRNKTTKTFERAKGSFNEDGVGLALSLHFGKSYARRFITNKNWGLWLNSPGVELNNGKIKRKRLLSKDNWQYYFDLTISSSKPFEKDFGQQILSKAKAIIGIDRGEKYPIAYVIKNIGNGQILDEGLLGSEFIKRLEEIDATIKKYQEVGNILPVELKKKKSNLKKTSVTSLIGFLLGKAAEYHAVFAVENLDRSFQGSERSIIPKKTYVAVEDSLVNALEFAGLLEKSRSRNSNNDYYGALLKINKAGTSQTCPKCKTIWKKETKEAILDNVLKEKNNINYTTGIFSLDGEKYKLAEKFNAYNFKNHSTEEKTLDMLKTSLEKREQFKKIFLGLLGPRISQEKFICPKVSCRFIKNADLVGASNITDRGIDLRQKFLQKK